MEWPDMSQLRNRTTPNNRIIEWETSTKEFGVGQSMDGARETLARKIALGGRLDGAVYLERAVVRARERSTRDGGSEGNQDWDEGESPHNVWMGRKEGGEEGVEEPREEKREARSATGETRTTPTLAGFYDQTVMYEILLGRIRSACSVRVPA
jgi:hypothetical protein